MTYDEAAWKGFEDEMVGHSQKFARQMCNFIGEDQLRVALREAMARADGHGFNHRGPVRLFIEMGFLFGSHFDTDPQYPWAGTILSGPGEQMPRAEELYEKILDYQKKVHRPRGMTIYKAVKALSELASNPQSRKPDFLVPALRQELFRHFPEHSKYVGTEGINALIHEGIAEADKHDLVPGRGETVITAMMLAMGHGCTRDPLHHWIARVLEDETIVHPEDRSRRLEEEAIHFLKAMGIPAFIPFSSTIARWIK